MNASEPVEPQTPSTEPSSERESGAPTTAERRANVHEQHSLDNAAHYAMRVAHLKRYETSPKWDRRMEAQYTERNRSRESA